MDRDDMEEDRRLRNQIKRLREAQSEDQAILAFVLDRVEYLEAGEGGTDVQFKNAAGCYPTVRGDTTREAIVKAIREDEEEE